MKKFAFIFVSTLFLLACSDDSKKEEPGINPNNLAANAPADKPQEAVGADAIRSLEKELEPVIEQAKASLPAAKERYLKGMKKGESFYLTISLREGNNVERIFVLITKWSGETVTGKIANDIAVLKDYKIGQEINFKETEVMDWTISKPDGSEEGNYIGKFIDAKRQ